MATCQRDFLSRWESFFFLFLKCSIAKFNVLKKIHAHPLINLMVFSFILAIYLTPGIPIYAYWMQFLLLPWLIIKWSVPLYWTDGSCKYRYPHTLKIKTKWKDKWCYLIAIVALWVHCWRPGPGYHRKSTNYSKGAFII